MSDELVGSVMWRQLVLGIFQQSVAYPFVVQEMLPALLFYLGCLGFLVRTLGRYPRRSVEATRILTTI